MKVNLKYCMLGFAFAVLIAFYFVDKECFMKNRVLRHKLWEYDSGADFGDFIYIDDMIRFEGNKMVFRHKCNDKYNQEVLILKWQYFNSMKVQDSKTGETAIYCMKGANWMDYILKQDIQMNMI